MNRIEAGFAAGCVATLPMTMTMTLVHRFLPAWERYALPPRQVTMKMLGKAGIKEELNEPEKSSATWTGHFLYGAMAGAAYAPLLHRVRLPAAVKGTAFGLFVWAASYLGWLPAAGILRSATKQPKGRTLMMLLSHVVWGAATGILVERMAGNQPKKSLEMGPAPEVERSMMEIGGEVPAMPGRVSIPEAR